jgi:DnaK suppressor protein
VNNWRAQRDILESMKQQIEHRIRATGDYGLDDAMADELGELSLYDNHPADIASELFERGKDVALRDRDQIRRQEIDRAVAAIDAGTYGICEHCGEAIDEERLAAEPTALLCIACKRQDETRHQGRIRPVEEEVLAPGFGRSDLDHSDSVEFDGEDAWQAVARFNQRKGAETDYDDGVGELYLNDNEGIVDDMDGISNEVYKSQIP